MKQIYRIKYTVEGSTMRTGLMRKEDAESMIDYLKERYDNVEIYVDEYENTSN